MSLETNSCQCCNLGSSSLCYGDHHASIKYSPMNRIQFLESMLIDALFSKSQQLMRLIRSDMFWVCLYERPMHLSKRRAAVEQFGISVISKCWRHLLKILVAEVN
mmetsp:Transcript_45202/g.83650  ORF Transcript_45202/g.83650 Transcript_45202/m.83650 type:complete len:105 (-) Transcript_45202:15-329(-)